MFIVNVIKITFPEKSCNNLLCSPPPQPKKKPKKIECKYDGLNLKIKFF